jgi:hypothetical protein
LTYTATSLVNAVTYSFTVAARNEFGFSVESAPLELYVGWISEIPTNIQTLEVTNTMEFTWDAPYNNGATITSYTIYIQQADGLFVQELVDCDGRSSEIVANTKCIVPIATLEATPFLLVQGQEVWAKVTATNSYGTSEESVAGNSGVIVVVPFPPISLRDDVDTTTAFVIGLLWEDNANNGGKPVLDYIVS